MSLYPPSKPCRDAGDFYGESHCVWCGVKFCGKSPLTRRTRDHILPKSRGGSNEWSNIQALCGACNGLKADTHIGEGVKRKPSKAERKRQKRLQIQLRSGQAYRLTGWTNNTSV